MEIDNIERYNLEKYIFWGKSSGKTVCVLGGIHGNERCGINAIKKIISNNFTIEKGKVIFIIANKKAIEKNVRYIDEDLNRCFLKDKIKTNSYEEKIAKELKPILNKCDILIDIHASSTPNSTPFIIAQKNAKNIIKYLPINSWCMGFDEIQPGGTDYYMNSIGKIGICVECGYLKEKQTTLFAQKIIYNFLQITKIINSIKLSQTKKNTYKVEMIYYSQKNFQLDYQFKDFEYLKKETLIGIDNKTKIFTKKEGFILFAQNSKEPNEECFLFGKKITIKRK